MLNRFNDVNADLTANQIDDFSARSAPLMPGMFPAPQPGPAPNAASAAPLEQQLAQVKALVADVVQKLQEENKALRTKLSLLEGVFPEDTLNEPLPQEFHGFFANRALHKLLTR